MPWKTSDARKFTKKARSKTASKQWRAVANSTRRRLLVKGVPAKRADATAVRTANGVVKKRKK